MSSHTTRHALTGLALTLTLGLSALASAQSTSLDGTSPLVTAPTPTVDFVLTEAPDDHVIGESFAPITVIAYASVMCPHCAHWFSDHWPSLKADYVDTGKIRFVFREFPTAPAQLSVAGFMIANCAGEDNYMENIEYQMANQEAIIKAAQDGKAQEKYLEVAQKSGLKDENALQACFADQSNFARIDLSMDRATAGEVASVPSFFVDGEQVKDNPTYENLALLIDQIDNQGLTKMPKNP